MIEAFSVPPDLAARGLTGEVVATRFLDQFKAMQAATGSDRPADTFQYNWGSEIKVEIPETGLTFGELGKLLRDGWDMPAMSPAKCSKRRLALR